MMSQNKGNQNGCSEQRGNVDGGIGDIINGLKTYTCEKLCIFKQDITCCDCKLSEYIGQIEAEYEKVNSFSQSAAYQLMKKYRKIVLCAECIYRMHGENYDWCALRRGLDESLEEHEGCSRGKERE